MTPHASNGAMQQLRLRYRLAAAACAEYVRNGFTVVVEDVVAGPLLQEAVDLLAIGPERVFVLMPAREVVAVRERGRDAKGYGTWSVDELYDVFEAETPRIGSWLDTSNLTPEETVDAILK
jgi:hypothetical protein